MAKRKLPNDQCRQKLVDIPVDEDSLIPQIRCHWRIAWRSNCGDVITTGKALPFRYV
nr:hypothetical protein [Agrobacterium tumefaciens]